MTISQNDTLQEEAHLRVLRLINRDPEMSQRVLAEHLGISLGKANYLLRGLVEKGLVKVQNFRNSENRWGYLYQLTPTGIEHKAFITLRYMKRRMAEYEALREEIDQLQRDLDSPA